MNASQCATRHDLNSAVRMTILSAALCLAAALAISMIDAHSIQRMNRSDMKAAVHEALIESGLSQRQHGK